jgi:Na+-translocating ferredoxin:NAD+ oxidoreductase subunit G
MFISIMKMDFDIGLRRLLLCAAAVCALGAAPSPARAQGVVFKGAQDLLADFFRSSQAVTYQKFALAPADRERLTRRLGYAPAKQSYTFYVAKTAGRVDGYALIDDELGEHLPITFAVKLSPAGVVERQEVLAYREPYGDEVRTPRFRGQFVGKTVRDPVQANRDIMVISGATISSRSMAVGVRRALLLFDELVRPSLSAQASSGRAAAPAL